MWKPSWTAIPNFIDTDRFAPGRADALRAELGIPADALIVLTAAAIERHHKRIDHLLADPNFIDTDRFAPGRADALRAELGIPADALIVLTAAAIERHHKRIDHLLAEFARLRQQCPDLPVWLVVAGGWEAETDALVAEGTRRLGDRVRFLVRFPRQRMPDLYRAADVFALCSLFEMQGIVFLEAAATYLPCVAHRHPIFEWVTGAGGLRVDMAAPGELSAALGTVLSDPERRRASGSPRAHCVANFSRDAVVGQILSYYRQVRGERRPPY